MRTEGEEERSRGGGGNDEEKKGRRKEGGERKRLLESVFTYCYNNYHLSNHDHGRQNSDNRRGSGHILFYFWIGKASRCYLDRLRGRENPYFDWLCCV